jgi:DNA repair exonuclease SbcCD ATPase subunit
MAKWKEIPPPDLLRERIEQLAATNEELSTLHREYEKLLRERIEELEADLRKMALDCIAADGQAAEAYQAQLAAEAKLEKAIGALEKVQAFVRDLEPHADQGHTLVPALREACETLKEIKGDTDE